MSPGTADTEKAVYALLAQQDTPVQDTGISPAMAMYGYPLQDHLPSQNIDIYRQ